MKPLKYSRQRESIINFLASRKDHPTADTIYKYLREEQPNLSLGTVYRNLSLLTELGEISKLSYGIGPDHFDGNTVPHLHFVCEKCGAVSDFETCVIPDIMSAASENFDGYIAGYSLHFYGRCPLCKEID